MVVTTETALDWYRRSQRQRAAAQIPTDPSSAATAFVRGASGFAPLDAAWRSTQSSHLLQNSSSHGTNYPVVILEGNVGKTWTLLSLAARFVVMTRASRFDSNNHDSNDEHDDANDADQVMQDAESPSNGSPSIASTSDTSTSQPQVILLDSNWDMTISKLAYMVRSTLLREPSSSSSNNTFHVTEEALESEVEGCLRRIHLATVDEVQDAWVPILECLRCKLRDTTKHPTLLLWDGFYTDTSKQPEVRRQVLRLLQDCSIAMVATGSSHGSNSSNLTPNHTANIRSNNHGPSQSPVGNRANFDWLKDKNNSRDLHRIQLEQKLGKDCYAIFNGSKLPFSISLGGVLS